MTKRTIASENRVGGGGPKFPKLEFKNKGERHRLLLFQMDAEGQPVVWAEYVHVLRVPKFYDDKESEKYGLPKMTLKDSKRNEDEKYEDYDTDWLGTPLCPGNPEVIEREGFDPQDCPVCAAVPDAPSEAKLHPQLTFAVNVVDYVLSSGAWTVQRPLSAKVVIWRFSAGTYDDIISQQEQHGELLRKQDLTLEVVSPSFRTVKMGVMAPSGWQESDSGGAYLQELLNTPGNIASDDQLRSACGRDAKRIFMQEDLAIVLKKWRKAKAALGEDDPAGGAALGGGQTLASGVSDLLNGTQPDPAATAQAVAAMRDQTRAEVTQVVSPDNPFAEFTGANSQAAAEAQHAQAVSAQPAADPFASAATGSAVSAAPAVSADPASPPTAPPSDPFATAGQDSAAGSVPASSPSAPSAAETPAVPGGPASSPIAAPPSDPFASAASGILGSGSAAATSPVAAAPAPAAPAADPFAAAAAPSTPVLQAAAAPGPTAASSPEPGPAVPAAARKSVSFDEMIASLDRGKQ